MSRFPGTTGIGSALGAKGWGRFAPFGGGEALGGGKGGLLNKC